MFSSPSFGSEGRGRAVISVFQGAWRCPGTPAPRPPQGPWHIAAESDLLPLLRDRVVLDASRAREVDEAWRRQVLRAALYDHQVEQIADVLEGRELPFFLLKGRACARYYHDPDVRTGGDIDLCVPPGCEQEVMAALTGEIEGVFDVDVWHADVPTDGGRWQTYFERGEDIFVGGRPVRVLSAEDHIAYLCAHFVRHGGNRLIWLLDIAAALDGGASMMDWDRCLGDTHVPSNWIMTVAATARSLLDVRSTGVPGAGTEFEAPKWFVHRVIAGAAVPPGTRTEYFKLPRIESHYRHPLGLVGAVIRRWPDPIVATARQGQSFRHRSPLPTQAADFLLRGLAVLERDFGTS